MLWLETYMLEAVKMDLPCRYKYMGEIFNCVETFEFRPSPGV